MDEIFLVIRYPHCRFLYRLERQLRYICIWLRAILTRYWSHHLITRSEGTIGGTEVVWDNNMSVAHI